MTRLDHLRALDPASADAIEALIAERVRQIEVEGWSRENDDQHLDRKLAAAAAAYALEAGSGQGYSIWPWHMKFWKPSTPGRDLAKAGALIIAEMARIKRKGY